MKYIDETILLHNAKMIFSGMFDKIVYNIKTNPNHIQSSRDMYESQRELFNETYIDSEDY